MGTDPTGGFCPCLIVPALWGIGEAILGGVALGTAGAIAYDTYQTYDRPVTIDFPLDIATTREQNNEFVRIYKAPTLGTTSKLMFSGFQAEDFPRNPPYQDGAAYFAGPNDRHIAVQYAMQNGYDNAILEIAIPKSIYQEIFSTFEEPYLKEGTRGTQLRIPHEYFPFLNIQFRYVTPVIKY